jgi:hypothetical protein
MAVFALANANYSFGVSEVDTGPVPSVSGNQVFFRVDSARDDFDVFGTGFTTTVRSTSSAPWRTEVVPIGRTVSRPE